jgi:hypothetical protein
MSEHRLSISTSRGVHRRPEPLFGLIAAMAALPLLCAARGTSLSHAVSDVQIEPLTADQRKPVETARDDVQKAAVALRDFKPKVPAAEKAEQQGDADRAAPARQAPAAGQGGPGRRSCCGCRC